MLILFTFQSLGLAFAMPNCFDGRADSEDHRAHVAYTLNGEVAGELYVAFVEGVVIFCSNSSFVDRTMS